MKNVMKDMSRDFILLTRFRQGQERPSLKMPLGVLFDQNCELGRRATPAVENVAHVDRMASTALRQAFDGSIRTVHGINYNTIYYFLSS